MGIMGPVDPYYPIALDLRRRRCVVVGGGPVAERKVASLLDCQAEVAVIAREASVRLRELAEAGAISLEERDYRRGDLAGAFLAMGATDDRRVNEAIFQEAGQRGLLVNIADDPEHCNFILPATLRRGDLVIAITTGGKSPALARQLRLELEDLFPAELGQHLEVLARYRRLLQDRVLDTARREAVWREVMAGGLLDLLRQERMKEAQELVQGAVDRAGIGR